MKIKDKIHFRSLLNKINLNYIVLIVFMIVIFVWMCFRSEFFLSVTNMDVLVNNFIMEAIMALGMTMVIISGGIDISISGILPFTAIIFAELMLMGMSPLLAAIIALLCACIIGLINNELRRFLKIHPMIVTMATQLTLKGLNLAITKGSVLSGFPDTIRQIGKAKPFGLSPAIWIYIILAIFFLAFSKNNKKFLYIYFVGGNKEAAKLSGMNVEGTLRFVYIMSAALAGLAGILSATVYNSASYSFGQGAEMRVITAVAIGGTSLIHGGEGSIRGTLLGSLFMALIYNAFIMSGISTYYQDVFTGALLVIAVLLGEGARMIKKNGIQKNLTQNMEEEVL